MDSLPDLELYPEPSRERSLELSPEPYLDMSCSRSNASLESASQLLDFHLKHIHDISRADSDSELMKALHLLGIAMNMVKRRQGSDVAKFHLRRVQAFGMMYGIEEFDLHLHFLMECVQVVDGST